MPFSSPLFIFCFLPLLLLAWQGLALYAPALLWLAPLAFSACFYAWSGLAFFIFFCLYTGMIYILGLLLARGAGKGFFMLALGLALAPLIWFKYSGFLADNLALLLRTEWTFDQPDMPPGLSFITFIQTAWLCGVRQGRIRPQNPLAHASFSSFFPYVLAGPIVRQDQVSPQLQRPKPLEPLSLAAGASLFSMGLAKKVLLADNLAPLADRAFNAAAQGWALGGPEAWLGAVAYSFQLYFDFSGYTDMALGTALMLGVRLPQNFNSPYKATGIVEFWRRWHITLGAWLRDFLYIPLGGSRRGRLIQYRNLCLTMLLGGIWHGAGWTFMIWGALHGLMLSVNHFFRAQAAKFGLLPLLASRPAAICCTGLTFVCLVLTWVVFRAPSLDAALAYYRAMFSPGGWADHGNGYFGGWLSLALPLLAGAIVFCLPNSQEQLLGRRGERRVWPAFSPGPAWACYLALLACAGALLGGGNETFLYFRF